ncbi:hypothetical protein [Flavobacteriaceae bacterium 14752]|uniref:hypothetical protein n=1 Tax=Mesohalobacter salilacus TaxID=2491711 RepID=UPI000F63DABB|nr:hypothetical protein EIG84_12280 [Flavobacteriaceae bacterium 14752]
MGTEKFVLDGFEDADIKYLIGYSKDKNKIARFFENRYESTSNSYLSTINVFVGCEIESCDFGVEIYSVGKNGNPDNPIYDGEITGYAKEGNHWTVIDVSGLGIKFPKQGLFIVLKWLLTEENFYEFNGHKKDPNKRFIFTTYAPQFGTYPKDNRYLWVLKNDVWEKEEKNTISILRKYEDKYTEPAIELEFES